MTHSTPYVPALLTQACAASLDDQPVDLIWSALRMPPEVKQMRYAVTLSYRQGVEGGTIALAKLSQDDLDLLLDAITNHVKAAQVGVPQRDTRIHTATGALLIVLGQPASAQHLMIQVKHTERPTRMLTLDVMAIYQAVESIQTIRRAFARSPSLRSRGLH